MSAHSLFEYTMVGYQVKENFAPSRVIYHFADSHVIKRQKERKMPMRGRRVVAAHCGGLLTKEDLMLLMHYARMCAFHVVELASLQDH